MMKKTGFLLIAAVLTACFFSSCTKGIGKAEEAGTDTVPLEKGVLILDTDTKGHLYEEKGGTSFVNFSVREGTPLFKRNSFFLSGASNFKTGTPYLLELRSRTARFSMPLNCDNSSESVRDLMRKTQFDASGYGTAIRKYSTPLWIMFYATPSIKAENIALYGDNAKWYSPDYSVYDSMWTEAAAYMAEKNYRSLFEVWNEPDQPNYMWYSGFDGYIELYEHSSVAVRKGDPDAFVGGPAMSSQSIVGADRMKEFVSRISSDGAPLDFFSMHYYGNDPKYTLSDNIRAIRESLENNPSTQIIFTEFNTHCPAVSEWDSRNRTDYTLQKSLAAAKGLDAMTEALSNTDVTQIQWANLFSDNGSLSLIDPKGNRSPLYHALWLYQHMPVERVKTEINADVSVLASSNEASSGILIWNSNEKKLANISLGINGIPYGEYTVKVYRIDTKHSSYLETGGTDSLETVTVLEKCHSSDIVWDGTVPAGGTVYISIETGAPSKLDSHRKIGTIVRSDCLFENREGNTYGDFDDLTCTATVGTGENGSGRGFCAVTLKNPADRIETDFTLVNIADTVPENAFISVRVDYHTPNGYSKSTEYSLLGEGYDRSFRFGTEKKPDKTVRFSTEKSGKISIDIKGNAPDGWDGKILISFDMGNTGKWSEATFILSKE